MKIDMISEQLKTGYSDLAQKLEKLSNPLKISFKQMIVKGKHQSTRRRPINARKATVQKSSSQNIAPLFDKTAQSFDLVPFIKTNHKATAAGVVAIITLSIGVTSLSNYINSSNELNSLTTGTTVQNSQQVQLVVTPTKSSSTSGPIDYLKPLSAIEGEQLKTLSMRDWTKLLTIGPVFESQRPSYVLRINNRKIAYFKAQAEAQEILDRIVESRQTENAELVSLGFSEDVKISYEDVSIYEFSNYSDPTEVEELIRTGTNEKRLYTVKNGDVLGKIATDNGMSLKDLYAANPGIETRKYLQIGDELNLVVPVPLINVQTVERIAYTEAIPYTTVNENNANLYKGETSVKIRGANGERQVQAEVIKINGVETERVILSETVAKEPTTRVLSVGTKAPPPTIGTGKFVKPVSRSYTISSPFGSRWGRLHTGIDLAMPTGSNVLAADGGKVIFAGNQGTYGRLVVIDHGGNLQSYYAHNSQILVKKGDNVFQGQKIALSGNTGRSTGPHLHFEIRLNGIPQNPTKYLRL